MVKLQAEGELPFYINPDTDSLYCWQLELHDFADSSLKEDMKKKGVTSVM